MNNYKEFWKNIIQKIEDLKKLDPKCKIIASAKHYHQYQRLPVVSANTIIAFEKENKVNLPESYFSSEDEEHPINKLHGLLSLGRSGARK